jgi:hypothetical protein
MCEIIDTRTCIRWVLGFGIKPGMTDSDEDKPLLPSTSSLDPVPASTLEAEAPQATTSSTAAVEASQVEGEIISE